MENTLKSENTCQKVKRDAFTMPINDHQLIQQIVQDALSFRMNINKSEVVRAGLQLLANLSNIDLKIALSQINKVKIGRGMVTIPTKSSQINAVYNHNS